MRRTPRTQAGARDPRLGTSPFAHREPVRPRTESRPRSATIRPVRAGVPGERARPRGRQWSMRGRSMRRCPLPWVHHSCPQRFVKNFLTCQAARSGPSRGKCRGFRDREEGSARGIMNRRPADAPGRQGVRQATLRRWGGSATGTGPTPSQRRYASERCGFGTHAGIPCAPPRKPRPPCRTRLRRVWNTRRRLRPGRAGGRQPSAAAGGGKLSDWALASSRPRSTPTKSKRACVVQRKPLRWRVLPPGLEPGTAEPQSTVISSLTTGALGSPGPSTQRRGNCN